MMGRVKDLFIEDAQVISGITGVDVERAMELYNIYLPENKLEWILICMIVEGGKE